MKRKLKLRLWFLIITICFYVNSDAQNVPTENGAFIPKITMPSPEAFSFTRYGDIPVGLFTGSMNYSIPLFQLKTGKLSVPVSLNYATNGIKVDAVSGRTGMDWTLNAGGVITRNILGKPDNEAALIAPSSNDSSSWTFFNYLKYVASTNGNTQPDEFSYNFLGQSGKFYFDYAGNLRELTPSGLKIVSNSNFDFFKITAQDGTLFEFTTGEETYSYSLFGDNNALNNSYGGRTSWYLTKIKTIAGDSIVYTYGSPYTSNTSTGVISYLSGISQTYKAVDYQNSVYAHFFQASNCKPFGSLEYYRIDGNTLGVGMNTDVRISAMNTCAALLSIQSKEGTATFHYSQREDYPGEVKLDSVRLIANLSSELIKTIGLNYIYSQSSSFDTPIQNGLQSTYTYLRKRLFLDRVVFYNQNFTDSQYYRFDYNSINDLPPRLSFAQDYFGYFNGKNNANLLPTNTIFGNSLYFNSVASNRATDTNYVKKGVLTKITYPTGGHTAIEYQSNYIANYFGVREVFDTITVNLNFPQTGYTVTGENFRSNLPYKIKLSAEWITPPDYNGPLDDSAVSFSINNYALGTQYVVPGHPVEIVNGLQLLNSYTDYSLTMTCGNANVKAKAEYIHFREVRDTVPDYPMAGVRVSGIKNYTADDNLVSHKKIYYNKPDGKSSGTSVIKFNSGADYSYPERVLVNNFYAGNYVLSSSSFFGNYSTDYGTMNYEFATEHVDSLGSGGSVTTQFLIGTNTIATTLGCTVPNNVQEYSPFLIPNVPTTNTALLHGKEFKKTWYKNQTNTFKKIKEQSNYYSIDQRLYHIDSFYVIRDVYQRGSYDITLKYFADHDVNKYKRISAWTHLDSTIQKEIDDNDRVLTTKTMYTYGNATHMLPTEVSQINSKGNTVKKNTAYTHDLLTVQPGSSVLNALYNANIINTPLVNSVYLNNTFLSADSTNYGSNLFPSSIYTRKANAQEYKEIEFTQYDAQGNLAEFNAKGMYKSILTDDESGNMVAGCDNCSQANLAYTSFETNYAGNWSISSNSRNYSNAVTGVKSYDLSNGSITRNSLSGSTYYIVSYWRNSNAGAYTVSGSTAVTTGATNNGWTYYEHLVTGVNSITISGSGLIDELRLYPKDALMTTYTYKSLVGITSQCDANNKIIYYEYDLFGRLKLIRDEKRNILKTYQYNYQANTNQ